MLPSAGQNANNTTITAVGAADPNSLTGPSGYGPSNFVTVIGSTFAYKISFENDPTATAPAQSVTITQNLDPNLDWTSFQLTSIGFGDNNFVIPAASQHYTKTISITSNGVTFNVQMEAGIHTATGQVYATFYSLDPVTGLPPSNVLAGFLPPSDRVVAADGTVTNEGTGRGEGYLSYTVSPKPTTPTGTIISSVASIVFDFGQPIATNQVDDANPGLGTDPAKEAPVTSDANAPTAQVTAFPAYAPASFGVSWSGADGTGGSGVASYTVYVSDDGGTTYTPWVTNTTQTSGTYVGVPGTTYSFYVVATSNVGNIQTASTTTAAVSVQSLAPLDYWRWQNFNTPTNAGVAADTANPAGDGMPNLLKYALALDPTKANAATGTPFVGSANGALTLTYICPHTATDITYIVEVSGDLQTWISGPSFTQQVSVTALDAQRDQVVVRDLTPMTGTTKRFIRLRVTQP